MSGVEAGVVAAVVLVAGVYVFRRALAGARGEKGSCRSCGDSCGCAIAEAASRAGEQSPSGEGRQDLTRR